MLNMAPNTVSYDGRVWHERRLIAQVMQGQRLLIGSQIQNATSSGTTSVLTRTSSPQTYPQSPATPPYAYAHIPSILYSPSYCISHSSEDSLISPSSLGMSPVLRKESTVAPAQHEFVRQPHTCNSSHARSPRSPRSPRHRIRSPPSSPEKHSRHEQHLRSKRPQGRRKDGPIIADGTT